jgi:hypothetical protein
VPAGFVVDVRGGSYPVLTLEGVEDQHWRAHAGERVEVAGIDIVDSSGIVVEGFRAAATADVQRSRHVTVRGLDIRGAYLRVRQGEDVLLERNRIHDVPETVEPNAHGIFIYVYASEPSRRVTIRDNVIERTCDDPIKLVSVEGAAVTGNRISHAHPCVGDEHTDAIQSISGVDIVIRRNRIDDAAHGLQFTDRAARDGGDPDSVGAVIEDNVVTGITGYALHGSIGVRARIAGNTLDSSGDPPLGVHLSTDSGLPGVALDGYTIVRNRTNGALSVPDELLANGGVLEDNVAGR